MGFNLTFKGLINQAPCHEAVWSNEV